MFYLIEHRYGDSNDVSVNEGFVEAESIEQALDKLGAFIHARIPSDRIWSEDGTENSVSVNYYPEDPCKDGEECRNVKCMKDHNSLFSLFTIVGSDTEEPEAPVSRWHGWDGEFLA